MKPRSTHVEHPSLIPQTLTHCFLRSQGLGSSRKDTEMMDGQCLVLGIRESSRHIYDAVCRGLYRKVWELWRGELTQSSGFGRLPGTGSTSSSRVLRGEKPSTSLTRQLVQISQTEIRLGLWTSKTKAIIIKTGKGLFCPLESSLLCPHNLLFRQLMVQQFHHRRVIHWLKTCPSLF